MFNFMNREVSSILSSETIRLFFKNVNFEYDFDQSRLWFNFHFMDSDMVVAM